ncbi:MAG: adenine deaminase C-terminal domain-containing protein [Armatimonadota bacterium]|nr:adenine deaminase C-terminal domain-containing protein [Armatimonadota bacterium]
MPSEPSAHRSAGAAPEARWIAAADPKAHRIAAAAAAGRRPFDLVIRNVRVVNVYTGEVLPGHIGIAGGLFARIFPLEATPGPATVSVDGGGRFAVPGLVDCHLHIESSMVLPAAFAEAVVPRGVLTVTPDPHEIVNVMGLEGMRLLLEASRDLPLDVFFQVPSCVPATALETAGSAIGPAEVRAALGWERVVALGEVMDYPAVLAGDERMHAIVGAALAAGAVVEGHAPNLRDGDLAAFVAAGITSDHTLVTAELARERLRAGMTLLLQEKSLAPDVLRTAEEYGRALNVCLVTDDVMADDLVARGHLDVLVREAIRLGWDPVDAIRAATLAPARRMRLYDRGGIAPGLVAHLVLADDLEEFRAQMVFARGVLVAKDGRPVPGAWPSAQASGGVGRGTVRLAPPGPERFHIAVPAAGRTARTARVRVIEMLPTGTVTRAGEATVPVAAGTLDWEATDLCLAAVFERHGRTGTVGLGLVRGALQHGAVATTWAHDSHNLLVLGRSAAEMAVAARWVIAHDGGIVAVRGETVLAGVPLPVAGIMSDQPVAVVAQQLAAFRTALASELGFVNRSPIMALGVLPLAVAPALRLTDLGLVDVDRGELVDLFLPDPA